MYDMVVGRRRRIITFAEPLFSTVAAAPAAGGGGGFDADAQAWFDAVVSNGGSVSTGRKTIVNEFVVGLKNDNIWSKLDRLWLLAAENAESALTDLVALDLATAVNSPTFTTDGGYNGDDASSYVNTTYDPSTDGVNYQLDSACIGAWDVSTSSLSATDYILGSIDTGGFATGTFITPRNTGGFGDDVLSKINTDTLFGHMAYPGPGLFHANRSASNAAQFYFNGSSISSSAAASTFIPSGALYVDNLNGFSEFSPDQIAAVFAGGSLDATEAGNLYTRLRTYMTAVGVP